MEQLISTGDSHVAREARRYSQLFCEIVCRLQRFARLTKNSALLAIVSVGLLAQVACGGSAENQTPTTPSVPTQKVLDSYTDESGITHQVVAVSGYYEDQAAADLESNLILVQKYCDQAPDPHRTEFYIWENLNDVCYSPNFRILDPENYTLLPVVKIEGLKPIQIYQPINVNNRQPSGFTGEFIRN